MTVSQVEAEAASAGAEGTVAEGAVTVSKVEVEAAEEVGISC